ncbi:MAG: methyl-accepting chemotaxis protein [Pseudomonadota bacterium]
MRLTIKLKLIGAFTLLLAFAGGLGYIGIDKLGGMNARLKSLATESVMRVTAAQDIQRLALEIARSEKNIVLAEDPVVVERYQGVIDSNRQQIDQKLTTLKELIGDGDSADIAEFEAAWAGYVENNAQVIQLAMLNSNARARELSSNEAREAIAQAEKAVAMLVDRAAQMPAIADQALLTIARLKEDMVQSVRAEKNHIIASDDEEMSKHFASGQARHASADEKIEELRTLFAGAGGQAITQLADGWAGYKRYSTAAMKMSAENGNRRAFERSAGAGDESLSRTREALRNLVTSNLAAMERDTQISDQSYKSARNMLLQMLVAVLVVGFAAALWISSTITTALNKAVRMAQAVAKGDLTVSETANNNDEFKDLLDANVAMLTRLRDVVSNAAHTANQVAHGSSQLASSAEQLSRGATEQSSATQEASSAVEEMAANIRHAADNASTTETIADNASGDTRSSGEVVNKALASIETIAEKINIVQEIARQTDLLALNAAVEAARAGQHGKGFAVVAAEVRKLAERSQQAAAEINELSSETLGLSKEAGAKLEALVPNIERTAELVREISAASREQNIGAEQINEAMRQMDGVVQQNASASEEVSSVSDALAGQASELQSLLAFFKLDERGRQLASAGSVASAPAPVRAPVAPASRRAAPAAPTGQDDGFAIDLLSGEEVDDAHFEPYRDAG